MAPFYARRPHDEPSSSASDSASFLFHGPEKTIQNDGEYHLRHDDRNQRIPNIRGSATRRLRLGLGLGLGLGQSHKQLPGPGAEEESEDTESAIPAGEPTRGKRWSEISWVSVAVKTTVVLKGPEPSRVAETAWSPIENAICEGGSKFQIGGQVH